MPHLEAAAAKVLRRYKTAVSKNGGFRQGWTAAQANSQAQFSAVFRPFFVSKVESSLLLARFSPTHQGVSFHASSGGKFPCVVAERRLSQVVAHHRDISVPVTIEANVAPAESQKRSLPARTTHPDTSPDYPSTFPPFGSLLF